MYASSNSSVNKCFDCGLSFNSPNELLNHKRRFCINSGYDNLEGLAKIQFNGTNPTHQPKIAHKNYLQHYGTNSLSKVGEEALNASTLQKEMKNINKFRRQLQGVNKYKHGSEISNSEMQSSKGSFGKQTRLTNNAFCQSEVNEELKKYEKRLPTQDSVGPTFIDQFNMRNHTVLDKSNTSLGRMPKKDRMEYAKYKLDQLNQIKSLYAQNGGTRQDFKANVERMIDFYLKFISQNQRAEEKDSLTFIQSRVSTPILKLRDLDQNTKKEDTRRSVAKKQSRIAVSKTGNEGYQPPHYPYAQPQVIMMPYPQQQMPNQSLRVLERMIELKSEQNQKLLDIMLEEKRRNNQNQPPYMPYPAEPNANSRPKQNRSNKKHIDTEEDYQFKKSMIQDLISEEKVLLALQQEELDEMKLLSQLPKGLQEIKLKSAIKSSESRHQIQKQILKQKMERLAYQGSNQVFEEERKLSNDQWAGEQRKKLLQNQMGKYVSNFQNEYMDNGEQN